MAEDIKLSQEAKEKMILRELSKKGTATANEIIDSFFKRDIRKGYEHAILKGWRFYVHLNKHYSVLKRRGLILHKGYKIGPSGKKEKIWCLSAKSINKYFPDKQRKKNVKLKIKMSVKKLREKIKKG